MELEISFLINSCHERFPSGDLRLDNVAFYGDERQNVAYVPPDKLKLCIHFQQVHFRIVMEFEYFYQ
jgi:hypothetical protein